MSLAALISDMVEAGVPAELIGRTAELIAAKDMRKDDPAERRREADRERKRLRKMRNSAENAENAEQPPLSPSPLSSPPTPPPIIPQTPIPPVHHQGEHAISEIVAPPKPKNQKPPELTPVQELMAVLDEVRARAVVEHRQKIRKPITAHAAKLLAGKFSKAESPNDAADHMIANGWQSFDPEWLENRVRTQSRGTGPAPPKLTEFQRRREENLAFFSGKTGPGYGAGTDDFGKNIDLGREDYGTA